MRHRHENLSVISKTGKVTEESGKRIIENYKNRLSIKDICNKEGIFRKAVEKLLLKHDLIAQSDCKYL